LEQASGKRKPADPTVDPGTVANATDPESGTMKTRHGWLQGYNAQVVVTTGQIILAADVTYLSGHPCDYPQFGPAKAFGGCLARLWRDSLLGIEMPECGCMLFWALLASGQITMRKVNGWQTLGETLAAPVPVDLAA